MNKPLAHVGKRLASYLSDNRYTKASLARKLNVSHSTVAQYTESAALSIGILWNISQALNHNFIAELGEELDIPYSSGKEADLKNQITLLQMELEKCRAELAIYQKIVGK